MNMMAGQPLTVTELNEYARRLLAGDPLLRNVEVTGEISGYKHHFSGHRYFSLKDASSRIQCVMFRQDAMSLDFTPSDGMKVTVIGSASVFVRDGSYQLYVNSMRKSGLGELYVRFEQLKSKLAAEGLFDPARKREIPMMPRKIGIVTAQTGAAVRDMIRVARRRNPNIGILVAPCTVQGAAAVPEIIRSIQRLNANGECDVLLVGRGGGSIEDLWAFNEEAVARAIASSRIPVISCVGHEIDFTIADFVADLRAPTPSAAAELAVPVLSELQDSLASLRSRLSRSLENAQQLRRIALNRLNSSSVLTSPSRILIEERRLALRQSVDRLNGALLRQSERARHRLDATTGMLRVLNPSGVVDRGYAIIRKNGLIATSTQSIHLGDSLEISMSDGTVTTIATNVKAGDNHG